MTFRTGTLDHRRGSSLSQAPLTRRRPPAARSAPAFLHDALILVFEIRERRTGSISMERPIDLQRLAIIGAGPIGIEAALAGRELGYDVRVYERGTVGGNLRRWGHVRLFSSFELDHSGRGARLLQAEGFKLPEAGEYLTGEEHLERYVELLSRTAPLSGCIHENTRVVSVGRDGIGKGDLIGGPRERYPFRLLVESEAGEEELVEADVLFDCSGTYGNHNWMGNGNVPALGERALEEHIAYELEDVTGTDRARYEAKRVLLVGDGHSASTALDGLRALPETTVHWVVRKQKPPAVIADDPLPERKRLSELAGELAAGGDARIHFYPEHTVESVRRESSAFEVELRSSRATKLVTVDRILAHVGYHPDRSLYRELQVHECYASLAPMKLAAALLGESPVDCLAQTSKGAEVLRNPEPNFFILGAKSYGKGSNFLIRIGLQQIEEVFGLLAAERRKERAS